MTPVNSNFYAIVQPVDSAAVHVLMDDDRICPEPRAAVTVLVLSVVMTLP